jgi:hypothetical protein
MKKTLKFVIVVDEMNQNKINNGTKLTTENPEHVILSLRSSSCT